MKELDPALLAREAQQIALALHQIKKSKVPSLIGKERGDGVARFMRIMELPELDPDQLSLITQDVDGLGLLCERFIYAIATSANDNDVESMISHGQDLTTLLNAQFSTDVLVRPPRFF